MRLGPFRLTFGGDPNDPTHRRTGPVVWIISLLIVAVLLGAYLGLPFPGSETIQGWMEANQAANQAGG